MTDRRIALVTGAGMADDEHGIGSATAAMLARAGCTVAVVDLDVERARTTARWIRDRGGYAEPFVADIAQPTVVAQTVAAVRDRLGPVDVLVNNAAVAVAGGLLDVDVAGWRRSLEVNLTGMFLMTRSVLPAMVDSFYADGQYRYVVNVGAVAGRRWTGVPMIAYSCSKGAIEPFTRSVALEFALRGIRANCVLPGLMDTPFYRTPLKDSYGGDDLRDITAKRDQQSPTGRQGTAWDVAHAVEFLASPNGSYINGHALVVDGGQSAQTWSASTEVAADTPQSAGDPCADPSIRTSTEGQCHDQLQS